MPDFTRGQFPSLDGDPAAEVAQRTEPDTDGNWFRKVFTVHNRAYTKGLDGRHPFHLTNFVAVLQSALQQGLHPKAAPELEAETDHYDGENTNLTYRVPVVPAVADTHPETTVTPSNLDTVLADPGALQPVQADPAPDGTTRWERGEAGTDQDGNPLLPAAPAPQPAAPADPVQEQPPTPDPAVPAIEPASEPQAAAPDAPATDQTPATEAPADPAPAPAE